MTKLLVAVVVLVFATGAANASPPMPYVGVVEDIGVNANPAVAQAAMKLARAAGFNTLRAVITWTYPGQADVVNDRDRVCNAAIAAAQNGMNLFLDVVPVNGSGQYGTPPDRSSQITKYDKTINDYMQVLIGQNGCARNLPELDIEVANEPNYSVFWPQDNNPAAIYTQVLARTYMFVHRQVAKNGFTVPVNVVGGELASSHDPVGFIKVMGQTMTSLGITGPVADMFSYHCYGVNGLAPTPPDAVRQALQLAFSSVPPLLCSEYGVRTGAGQSSEQDQGQLEAQAITMGACSGLRGVFLFHLFDDPSWSSNGWSSGLYYFDPNLGQPGDQPVPKASLSIVQPIAQAAQSSQGVDCGQRPGSH